MVADEQTHTLPAERDALERFARFLGFAGRDAFAEALLAHLRNVQRHYARLFENAPAPEAARALVVSRRTPTIRETLDKLAEHGFSPARSKPPPRCGDWLAGRLPFAQGRSGARASGRTAAAADRAIWRARKIPTPRWSRSTASSPACMAAAAVLAAAAESRPRRADRARARHRAAARRYPGAAAAVDGRADRSALLRRDAGGGAASLRARPSLEQARPTRTFSTASACSARSTCS